MSRIVAGCLVLFTLVQLTALGKEVGNGQSPLAQINWCDWNTLDWTTMKKDVVAWNNSFAADGGKGILNFTSVQHDKTLLEPIDGKMDWGLFVDYDISNGRAGHCDILIAAGSPIGFAESGLLQDLTDHVDDPRLRWDEMSLATRRYVAEYNERVIAIPIQIEFPLLYYRRDLISVPPKTWEDALKEAAKHHGKDLNGPNADGSVDKHAGFCMDPAGDIGRIGLGVFASVMKYKPGDRQGYMYDLADNDVDLMTPLFDSKGYAYALSLFRRMYSLSTQDFDKTRWSQIVPQWEEGNCSMYLTWAAAGGSARLSGPTSYTDGGGLYTLKGRMGTARMPGSTMVYDRKEKELVNCTFKFCNSMESGGMNRPSLQAGGNRFVVRKDPHNLTAAMEVITQASMAIDVRHKDNVPFRDDHYNRSWFVEAGWNQLDAEEYLNAMLWTTTHQHMVTYTPIPTFEDTWRIIEVGIKKACRATEYQSNTQTDEQIASEIAANVSTMVAASGYSNKELENRLRTALRLPMLEEKKGVDTIWIILSVTLLVVILLCVIVVSIIQMRNKGAGGGSQTGESQAVQSEAGTMALESIHNGATGNGTSTVDMKSRPPAPGDPNFHDVSYSS